MAFLECRSVQPGVAAQQVEVENISDDDVARARARLDDHLAGGDQISTVVANAFVDLATVAPYANPSDLWHHVIYRHLLQIGWSDQKWKRVSGFALERAFVTLYAPRLLPHGLRMRLMPANEANALLSRLGFADTRATKVDLFLEQKVHDQWVMFGAVHVKSSIAERIQDDVPASRAMMERNLVSIALTMDAKSYPPPHGNCINYGELGGRSLGVDKERLKRGYIEVAGQFDGLFSYNLRTPKSPECTASGKRIHSLSLNEGENDQLVRFLLDRCETAAKVIEA